MGNTLGNTSSAATKKISPLVVAAEKGRRAQISLATNNATLGAAAKLERKGSGRVARTLSDERLEELANRTGGGKRKKIKSKKRTKRNKPKTKRRKNHTKKNHTRKRR